MKDNKITYSVSIISEKSEILDSYLLYCCTDFMGGLLEKVLYDIYEINWIESEQKAQKIIKRLRKKGITEGIGLTECTEDGNTIYEKEMEMHILEGVTDIDKVYEGLRNKSIRQAFIEDKTINTIYDLPF